MNWLVLLYLDIFIVLEGIYAYFDKFLFMWQAKSRVTKDHYVGVFIEHFGMWGDFFIVSPWVAYTMQWFPAWSMPAKGIALAVSAILTAGLVRRWKGETTKISNALAHDGKTSIAGWLPAFYMFIVFAEALLFYCATPRAIVDHQVLIMLSVALIAHVWISTVLPEKHTYGKVKRETFEIAMMLTIVLIGATWRLM